MAFHHAHFRTFRHSTESEDKVRAALGFVAGDAEVQVTKTEGHFGNPLLILEARLSRNRDIRVFLKRLQTNGILDEVMKTLESRLDDECNLHFRLSKQKAYEEELALAFDKDVIDCNLKVAAYPAKRSQALSVVQDYFDKL